MRDDWKRRAAEALSASADLHRQYATADLGPIVVAAEAIVGAVRGGGRLLLCGNGGSASDAQHVAAELVGRFQRQRRAFPAISLTVDTSVLTSIANDFSYDAVFARQVEALAGTNDVLFGISTSGQSANVLKAFETARRMSVKTIALTANDGGPLGRAADVHINVPSASTARAQEVHRTILHAICELVEGELGGA